MNLSRLAVLKDKLVNEQEFIQVWNYFLDHFGDKLSFIALGKRTSHPFLEAFVSQLSRTMFQHDVSPRDLMLTLLPEHKFIHGSVMVNTNIIGVIFFEDIQVGMATVVQMRKPKGDHQFIRFRGPGVSLKPSEN